MKIITNKNDDNNSDDDNYSHNTVQAFRTYISSTFDLNFWSPGHLGFKFQKSGIGNFHF